MLDHKAQIALRRRIRKLLRDELLSTGGLPEAIAGNIAEVGVRSIDDAIDVARAADSERQAREYQRAIDVADFLFTDGKGKKTTRPVIETYDGEFAGRAGFSRDAVLSAVRRIICKD